MDRNQLKIIAKKLVEKFAEPELSKGFRSAGLHDYRDKNGKLLYIKLRLKHSDSGEKWIKPFHFNIEKNDWIIGEPKFLNKKPIYNLPRIFNNPHEIIWIVEGESCADALSKLGAIATTSGGWTSVNSTDWSVLKERNVIVWADNDEKGFEYADQVREILTSLGCMVRCIDVSALNLQPKGDCVDWLAAYPHSTKDDLKALKFISPTEEHQQSIAPSENSNDDLMISALVNLSEIDYQRQRKDSAKQLGIPVRILDKLVKLKRDENNNNKKSKNMFIKIDPWPAPVELADLLNELETVINRILVFPSAHESKAIVLWIIHTHCLEVASTSPILNVNSPEKRCGKSTLLTILNQLVNRPLIASNITPAALFRSIEKWRPTLIIDEADTFMRDNEELRGIINSGHTRDLAFIIRCIGDKHEPERFSTWCSKVIAGIGHLSETIEDRSIIIRLRRKLPNEKREQLREISSMVVNNLLKKCTRFVNDNLEILREAKPEIPETLNDRAANNWEPLFAIAELASKDWSTKAKEAALYLSSSKKEFVSVSVELLRDIKSIFEERKIDRISTADLLEALCSDDESPWLTYNRGKPITSRQLATRIKEFGISSITVRFSYGTKKGFHLNNFEDAFKRYVACINPDFADTSVTTSQLNKDVSCNESHAEIVTVTHSSQNIHKEVVTETQNSEVKMLQIESKLNGNSHATCDAVTLVTDKSSTPANKTNHEVF